MYFFAVFLGALFRKYGSDFYFVCISLLCFLNITNFSFPKSSHLLLPDYKPIYIEQKYSTQPITKLFHFFSKYIWLQVALICTENCYFTRYSL